MKLTIQHWSAYLPYDLQLTCNAVFMPNRKCYPKLQGAKATLNTDLLADIYSGVYDSVGRFQPILRPLSDLTKEIEHNGERFVPIERLAEIWGNGNYIPNIRQCEWYCKEFYTKDGLTCKFYDHYPFVEISNQYQFTKKLFEWHFDVFGLIENNLAIDINTIQK